MVVEAPRRADGRLSLLLVEPGAVVTSTGEQLLVRYEKLQALAEQVCQEGAAVVLRTWASRDGPELVELYRAPWLRRLPVRCTGPATDAF